MITATTVGPIPSGHPSTLAGAVTTTATARRDNDRNGELLVRQAVTLIRQHVRNLPSVEKLAAALHVDRGTLHRHFRRGLRMSVSDAIRKIRLAEAKRLLTETDLPIAAVAAQAGYSSQAKMSDHFRRLLGKTPSEHRRSTCGSGK